MGKKLKVVTIPSFTYQDTSDPNVKRFVDQEGNWTHYWLVKEKRFVKAVNHILKLGYPKSQGFYEWLKRATPEEAERRLKTAGEEGTRTHMAIRDLAAGNRIRMTEKYYDDRTKRNEVLNADEWWNLESYVNFCNDYPHTMIAEEETVHTGTYAGTFDRLGIISVPLTDKKFPEEVRGKKVLALLDWKSSSALWEEYSAQIAAYVATIRYLPKYSGFFKSFSHFGVLVRLGTKHVKGYEIKVLNKEDLEHHVDLFISALMIANNHEPEFKPEIREIPFEFYHPIKKATKPRALKSNKK